MIFAKLFGRHKKADDDRQAAAKEAQRIKSEAEAAGNKDISEIDDNELVAVIAAALQAYSAESRCNLVIKSIKRTGITSPVWNKTGRMERLSRKLY